MRYIYIYPCAARLRGDGSSGKNQFGPFIDTVPSCSYHMQIGGYIIIKVESSVQTLVHGTLRLNSFDLVTRPLMFSFQVTGASSPIRRALICKYLPKRTLKSTQCEPKSSHAARQTNVDFPIYPACREHLGRGRGTCADCVDSGYTFFYLTSVKSSPNRLLIVGSIKGVVRNTFTLFSLLCTLSTLCFPGR